MSKNRVFTFVEIPIDCKKEDEENSNEDSNSDIIPDIPSKDDIAKDLETQFFNILVSQGSTPSELLGQLITLFQSFVSDPTYDYPTFLTQLGTFLYAVNINCFGFVYDVQRSLGDIIELLVRTERSDYSNYIPLPIVKERLVRIPLHSFFINLESNSSDVVTIRGLSRFE